MIQDSNYINIQGWMVTKLGLSGNDLMVYAIIYGFCQDGVSTFCGGRQYLADWCNSTVRGIQKNLNNLVEKGLIRQTSHSKDNHHVEYIIVPSSEQSSQGVVNKVPYSSEQSSQGVVNKVPYSSEQSSPYNIVNKLKEDKIEDNKDSFVQNFLTLYTEICTDLPKVRTMTDKRKKAIQKLYKKYSEDDIKCVLEKAEDSDFLAGRSKDWRADLDWIINENNFVKILEGRYDNRKAANNKKFAEYGVHSTPVTQEEIDNGYFIEGMIV